MIHFFQVAHSACQLGSEIICFGGGDGVRPGNMVYVLETESFVWDEPALQGMAHSHRYGHAAAVEVRISKYLRESIFAMSVFSWFHFQGIHLYVFGGYEVSNGYSNQLSVLDTSTMSWNIPFVNGMPPRPRACHTMSTVGRKIILFGGLLVI